MHWSSFRVDHRPADPGSARRRESWGTGVSASVRAYCTFEAPATAAGSSEVVAVADPELLHGPVDVRLDRPDREDESVGDLGVGEPLASKLNDVSLSRGQADVGCR